MKLWTIQPECVYELLVEKGEFICDSTKSANPDLREAYEWLSSKMDQKIPNKPNDVVNPIWAWYVHDWKNCRPDMRSASFRVYSPSVLMEIELDASEVLLSDFIKWHDVLNHCYLDDSTTEEEYYSCMEAYEKLPIEKREEVMVKSWDKIFDLQPLKTKWRTNGKHIQATFWKLKLSNVKNVWHLKGYPLPQ